MKARLEALLGLKDVTPRIGRIHANGATVPVDATSGYAVGCVFSHTDGGGQGDLLYVVPEPTISCFSFRH